MSENRKLLNALISFVVVGIFFFAGIYAMEYWEELGGGSYSASTNDPSLGSEVGAVLFLLFIFYLVLYFIFKYLISDTTKFKWRMKIENFWKRNKQ